MPIGMKSFEDDGRHIADVGEWAEEKYRLAGLYAHLFTTTMRKKWSELVYIDLFSGCGASRLRSSGRIVQNMALFTLGLETPFDKYIFCDLDEQCLEALQARAEEGHPDKNAAFLHGDVNSLTEDFTREIPQYSQGYTGLSFCFVDPFKLSNLRFETIQILAKARRMDFLILLPSSEANRNWETGGKQIADFLGRPNWLSEWNAQRTEKPQISMREFFPRLYSRQMAELGFIETEFEHMLQVRNVEKNAPLYHLAIFSRHPLAQKFWKISKARASNQGSLFSEE
jgi:three-Cys-motif partner protein